MPPDTEDGVRTLLLASLFVCGAVAAPAVAAGATTTATGVPGLELSAAAGNTPTGPTVSASVEPLTALSGRRATLVANVTGAERLGTVDWVVETPSRGTVERDGNGARFQFRTAGTYTVRLTVTDGDGQTARANTTVEMVQTTVRLRGPDGPPTNATLVLDGAGAVGSGVFAVPDDGRVPVLLRRGTDYAATALQDRDRTTPLHPDPGSPDGVPDFAVLGRVTASDDARFRLPAADPVAVRVVDAGGDRVVPRGRDAPGAVGIELRHDHPRLPASGFRALATNASGVAVLDGRPPELAGNVTAGVVPLAERFARTDHRLDRELTVDGATRTTFVLGDGTTTATAHFPHEAVVGESLKLHVTSPGSTANATWTVVGPDRTSRQRDGRQTTFVPQTQGRFDVIVAVETESGATAVDRGYLRVADRVEVDGVVRGPDGNPVADAVVRLSRVGNTRTAAAVRAGDGPPRRPTSAAITRTDATGRFGATLAAGREYRAVVAQTPLADPPRDGVPDVTLLDQFTAGVDDPGGRLPAARRVTVGAVDDDGTPLTVGLAGNTSSEVALFLGHTPAGSNGSVGWLPGRATAGGTGAAVTDESTTANRVTVEVPGPATLLGAAQVGWLADTARVTHTDGDTARLVVPASDQTPPVARLTGPTRAEVGTTVELDATHSTDAYGVTRYDWNGSGRLQTDGATAQWTPDTVGNQTVRVTVTDPAGNVATATATVTVRAAADERDDGDDAADGNDENSDSDDNGSGDDTADGGDGDDEGDETIDDGSTDTDHSPDDGTDDNSDDTDGSPDDSTTPTPTASPTVTTTPRRTGTDEPSREPSGERTPPTPTPPGQFIPSSLRPPAWDETEMSVTPTPPGGRADAPATRTDPRADRPTGDTESSDTPRRGDTSSMTGESTEGVVGSDGGRTSGTDGGSGVSPATLSLVALSSLAVGWVAGTRRDRRDRDDGAGDEPDSGGEPE